MAAIKKSDIKNMNKKELENKLVELRKVMLELEGEGKRDKTRPIKKAIAAILTTLSTESLNNRTSKSINVNKPDEKTKKVGNEK